jgi:hypothetical protein
MLSILGQTSANVGYILGDQAKGVIKNIVIFGGSLSSAQTADSAAIEAALAANSKLAKTATNKVYWLPEVQNFEDRAEQNTTGALNLGPTVMLKEGKPGYEIKVDGTSEFAKEMRKWNNKTVAICEYDSNRKLWGRVSGTDFKGYTAKIFVNAMRVASGQAPEEGIVTVTISFLSSTEYGDQAKALDLSNVDTSLIKTQVDAKFAYVSNAANVFTLSWGVDLGIVNTKYDVIEKYSTEIGTDEALFTAFTGDDYGTALAITSVAQTAGKLVVTFDATAYGALSVGDTIKFNSVAPSALEAADIFDIEGVAVVLTKEA